MTKQLQAGKPRLPARPSRVGAWLVYRALVRPALRRTFNRVLLDDRAVQQYAVFSRGTVAPVICYVTHVSWWDGYLGFELFRNVYPRTHFLMMEEAQLRRYFFFRWCGCFSVDRADPREGVRSLRYAATLLHSHRRALVWLFPQGEIVPPDQRPLQLYRGAARIATLADGVWCVPIALRYEFGPEQRPDALILFGEPLWVQASDGTATVQQAFEQRLTAAADALRDRWTSGDLSTFRPILHGRESANRLFDRAMQPLLRTWRWLRSTFRHQ